MKHSQDAYGQQLLAQYYRTGEETYEIIEREDGYIGDGSEAGAYFYDYPKWHSLEQKGVRLAKGRVLDIGAGAGRHSLWLQQHGHQVTAIDNSPGAVKVCRRRGVKDVRLIPIEKIGAFKPDSFDTIIMFGHNFGLVHNPKTAKVLLRRMHAATSPGARILAETRDPYKTKVKAHLEYQRLNRKRGRMSGQIRFRIRFEKAIGPWFDYLFVSRKEMREIVKGTGWKVERFVAEPKNASYIGILKKVR